MSSIVLFDGMCNFCNAAVNFIIARDRQKRFKFAPLQSDVGKRMRAEHGIGEEIDSLVLVENGQGYIYADAALRIVHGLGLPWKLAYGLMILPRSIREMAYRAFAKYRYKLFGQRNACMMPTPEMRERFL